MFSDSELAKLGLPSHHVHYRAGQPAGTELLAPEDIQVYNFVASL